ncbi:MAG: aminotransferase class V-fold PLP-dependent enzyme, partial [Anaerolineales bacterium]|nr:aminotransferase class V-fold PLP-dependent enzyme [Anaerolineales bacterium]
SNVTGHITAARRLAEKAHAAGAHILVDCAQLVPHRAVDVGDLDDPGHFDYIAFSGHKMYAPYGAGALVGRLDTLARGEPDQRGGGTVMFVSAEAAELSPPPDREEAGSPNVIGVVALAAAARQLQAIGMAAVAAHEAELTAHALEGLRRLEGVEVLGDADPARAAQRLGVIPFTVRDRSHIQVAAILSYEHGIGLRNGLFCAQPFIMHMLGLTPQAIEGVRRRILARDRRELPGLARASFGLYNTLDEVDTWLAALDQIQRGTFKGKYQQDTASGDFVPEGWQPDFDRFFDGLADTEAGVNAHTPGEERA